MSWELRKLLSDRVLAMLELGLFIACLLFFRGEVVDSGLREVQAMYGYEGDITALQSELWEYVFTGNEDYDGKLLTCDIYSEMRLVDETAARIEAARGYGEFVRLTCAEAAAKLHSGLFGTDGGFAMRSIERTEEVHSRLLELEVPVVFTGGIELLLGLRLPDIFALLFSLTAALILFSRERESGVLCLLRPTKRGRGELYCRKFTAVAASALIPAALMYAGCGIIAVCEFGPVDLSLPVQAVYGFTACPYELDIGGFLALFFLMKALWLLACAGFFTLAASALRGALALPVCALAAALSFALSALPVNLPRCLNLAAAGETARLFDGLLFLNFFSLPVPRLAATAAFCVLLAVLCAAGGWALFVKRSAVTASRRGRAGPALGLHLHPMRHELRKLFLSSGALAVLGALLLVQVWVNLDIGSGTVQEAQYRQYSSVLLGAPDAEKDAYILAEAARFDALREDYAALMQSTHGGAASGMGNSILRELEAEAAFLEARTQYEALGAGESYVYKTPYELLYGAQGRADAVSDTAKLVLALSLAPPFFFCMDAETGVEQLIISAGAQRDVRRRKRAAGFVFALLCATAAYVPRFAETALTYGLPELGASAASLELFSALPEFLPLWAVLAASTLACAAASVLAAFVTELISSRVRAGIASVLVCTIVLEALCWLICAVG